MKLYVKLSLILTSLMLFLFSVFGSSMIYFSFNRALSDAIEQGYNSQWTYHLLMSANMKASIDTGYSGVHSNAQRMEEMHTRIQSQLTDTEFELLQEKEGRLEGMKSEYTAVCSRLYQSLTENSQQIAYTEVTAEGIHKLCYMSVLHLSGKSYYVAGYTSVEQLYSDRDSLYQQYIVVLMLTAVVGGGAIFAIVWLFTRPIWRLRIMSKRFAAGDYSARSNIRSQDEIGSLSKDIDRMADRLEENIGEMQLSLARQESFTAAFSHELKTPMTAIVGYAQMLRTMRLTEDEVIDYADYIYTQGVRLEKLSRQMLNMMRLIDEEVQFESLFMPDIINEAVNVVMPVLHEKKITCLVQNEGGFTEGNRELMVMLLTNLIDNARKASTAGNSIWITGRQKKQGYIILVRDEGCGIPKEDLERVTEAFYMVDKSRARKQGGSGLGLALCDTIVKLHHGQMRIQSEVDSGTAIHIYMPKKQEGETE